MEKRAQGKKKLMLYVGVVVILAGVGGINYSDELWRMNIIKALNGPQSKAAASVKSNLILDTTIRNVSNILISEPEREPKSVPESKPDELVPLIEVIGAVKITQKQQEFFNRFHLQELEAKKRFSYMEWFISMSAISNDLPSEATINYLASILYEAAVKSGYLIGERHLHQLLPNYASPGFDAWVTAGGNDLTFYNPNEHNAQVRIHYKDNYPHLVLWSIAKSDWKQQKFAVRQTHYSPEQADVTHLSLAENATLTVEAGKSGLMVEVLAEGKLLTRDFYLPLPNIIGHGPEPKEIVE